MIYKTGQRVITLVDKPDYPSSSEGIIKSFDKSNVLIEFNNEQKGKANPVFYKFIEITPVDDLLIVDLRNLNNKQCE